ncbi:GNAT family N-acetyltransferase [Rosistilla oblonga]|uniref:BioF2-like acetyltransferase domain-containing protein n=1 Tax=Rosistilla oblonga TaxID=2527990 RepID=A0A518IPR5_9BACT|nr:GNAT family N-acetyltransferase [Rosistilla oblonga]QDV55073.1 hypothetical protein Mal33_10420 [Rosistilla oblonga]
MTNETIAFHYLIFDSADAVPVEAWNSVQQRVGDPFCDLRFIRVVETSMAADTRCWPVVFYDGKRPVAISCISRYRVDAGVLTGGPLQKLIGFVRRVLPSFLFLKIVFAGLPVSAGQRGLVMLPDTNHQEVVRLMDDALATIARREAVGLIVIKEFEQTDSDWADQFSRQYRYYKADSLPMNRLELAFDSFDDYLAARSSRSRSSIRQSRRRLRDTGCQLIQLPGGSEAIERFNDEAHRLYLAVLGKSHSRLETLPAEFFRELARQFGDAAHFTFIYQSERLVAVSCSLKGDDVFQMMFCGIDYSLNDQAHLYFNIMFSDLDIGFRQHVSRINVGQNGDTFKARLGCRQIPLSIYIKGRNLFRPLLWMFQRWFLPAAPLLAPIETLSGKRSPQVSGKTTSTVAPPATVARATVLGLLP